MTDEWEPGEPIYDEADPERAYQLEPMFQILADSEGRHAAARWTPVTGWTGVDVQ